MQIGVDFDNTLVNYQDLFHQVAVEKQLIPDHIEHAKSAVRDFLRQQGMEEQWIWLQGYVYGVALQKAPAFDGAMAFFQICHQRRIPICIISHKTRHPVRGEPHDLHQAATRWLDQQGFFEKQGANLQRDQVFFELTKDAKLKRIAQQGCTHFVDDLPEFLQEADFPKTTQAILFDPASHCVDFGQKRVESWSELKDYLFGHELR